MTPRENSDTALWRLPLEKLRERCLWVLLVCLWWGFIIALMGVCYHWGAVVRSHPRTYSYIPWPAWAIFALFPLVLMSIAVEATLAVAGWHQKKGADRA